MKVNVIGIVGFVIVIVAALVVAPRDDTDPGRSWHDGRSGLHLYIDAGTGCQYIRAAGADNMLPRVNGQGTHMGCKP